MVALGLLTGVSYQSGLDYYKQINEKFMALVPKGKLMPPNPTLLMVSVDCDEYAALLVNKEWDAVAKYLSHGVARLVKAEADCLVICSNTAHIAVPLVRELHPDLPVLHIADTTAKAIRDRGLTRVGLLGTEPTMREEYLKAQLRKHGVECVVPESDADLSQIFQFIMDELGFGVLKESTRAFFVAQVRAAAACPPYSARRHHCSLRPLRPQTTPPLHPCRRASSRRAAPRASSWAAPRSSCCSRSRTRPRCHLP